MDLTIAALSYKILDLIFYLYLRQGGHILSIYIDNIMQNRCKYMGSSLLFLYFLYFILFYSAQSF